jgi:RNA polymerase sigma-70 factor (ECF subfamily)
MEATSGPFRAAPRRADPRSRRESNQTHATDRIGDVKTGELRLASDAQLVVAIGRFRHDALSEVYRRHAPAAFGLARRIVGDRALAEEVVQEVFLRLWNAPDRFDAARGSLRTYLLTQTHGRSVDVVRAEAARRAVELRERLRPRA